MRVRCRIAAFGFLGFSVAAALPVLAEQQFSRPKTYGTADQAILTLGPCDASHQSLNLPFETDSCTRLVPPYGTGGSAYAGFPVHLPEGALIDAISIHYHDSIAGFDPGLGFYRISGENGEPLVDGVFPSFDQGENEVTFALDTPHEVHNEKNVYVINVGISRVDNVHFDAVYSVSVRYRLQVSPAPAVASFSDVPTNHTFFQFVEALAASGITAGCGGGKFCPNQPLTRGQMAVFLSKALGLHWPN